MARSKPRRAKPVQPLDRPADSLLGLLLSAAVGVLLVARLLVPTESAEEGGTIWIVQLWLAAGLVWAWNAVRERDDAIRWDRLDVAFWIFVAGHVVSAAAVLLTGGQKRAAINLGWEWVGLGVCLFLLRQTIRSGAAARQLVTMFLAASICLAALGLWQHYVDFPGTRREYGRVKSEQQRLLDAPAPASREEAMRRVQQLRETQAWLNDAGVPSDPAALALWEDRLGSSEPFGRFALTNSFAGLLLVWLIVALGVAYSVWHRRPAWKRLIVPALGTVLIGYCLLLTKSRTAWVGLAAGLAVWAAVRFRRSSAAPKKWLVYAGAGCGLLLALLTLADFSGGFDREVLTEAPKSLNYRLRYWAASLDVLRERPLLGTGPGNFRHHYLRHKRPASSEEIADPHNFVFDVWANGGLLALVGLFAFIALLFAKLRRADANLPLSAGRTSSPSPPVGTDAGRDDAPRIWNSLTIGGGLGFVVVFAATVAGGEGFDLQLPPLLLGWVAAMLIYGRISNSAGPSIVCLVAAAAALMIHLLGAGGIEMPAIVQTLLVLAAVASVWQESEAANASAGPVAHLHAGAAMPRRSLAVGGLFAVLFIACLLTATRPVLNGQAKVAEADRMILGGENVATATRLYSEAAEADPFSPVPLGRLADVYYRRWTALPGDSARDFERAVGFLQTAIEIDPHNPAGYRRLGQWHLERYRRAGDQAEAAAAVEALRQAAARYPHNAAFRAELAIALGEAGRPHDAAIEAQAALRQDAINRREGHRDKYLEPGTVDTLRGLAETPGASNGN